MSSHRTLSTFLSSRDLRAKILVAAISTAVSLGIAWLVFEKVQAKRAAVFRPKLLAVQEHLALHPTLGFLWRPNLNVLFPKELRWLDEEYEGIDPRPIVTDRYGFLNHPRALEGDHTSIDIVGVGDSFLHDMTFVLFEFFEERGLSYYNLSMHRYSPPQYNIVLRDYALPLRPKRVLYGVYENDFRETEDFEQWLESGQNWFAYHGGLWAGQPPKPVSFNRNAQFLSVLGHIRDAHQLCERDGIEFTVLLIPSKKLMLFPNKRSIYDTRVYNKLAKAMDKDGIPYLDVREVFGRKKDVRPLYWKKDSHWSHAGSLLAA